MSLAEDITDFIHGTRFDDIPDADLLTAERSCLDAIGTGLAGSTSRQARMVADYVRCQGGEQSASVIGTRLKAPGSLAALANGTAVHADDFDDSGGFGHPSASLIPVLMVASELRGGISGREFLAAYVVGFEVATAISVEGHYDQIDNCFHSTSLFGVVAAAAAAARVLELNSAQTVAAIALAASQACGLNQQCGTMVKPLHAGLSASGALTACELAAAGVEGAADVLEARGGYVETFFRHRAFQPSRVVSSLGQPYRLSASITIKSFPCCGWNQSALHAARRIVVAEGLRYGDIEAVSVEGLSDTAQVLRYPSPKRGLNGKFSIAFAVGSLLLKGGLSIDDFSDEAVVDPEVIEATGRVQPEVLARWDKRSGKDFRRKGNAVVIRTIDGRRYENATEWASMPGSPLSPLPQEDLEAKFMRNATRALSADAAVEAVALWREFRELGNVGELMTAITPTMADCGVER